MPEIREIATDLRFPEGPIAMPDGSILFVEIAAGTLTRITSEGKKELAEAIQKKTSEIKKEKKK